VGAALRRRVEGRRLQDGRLATGFGEPYGLTSSVCIGSRGPTCQTFERVGVVANGKRPWHSLRSDNRVC
jgi:hypothetical protein